MAAKLIHEPTSPEGITDAADDIICTRLQEALRKTGVLQKAVFKSSNFSSIVTDDKGIIRILNVGAERTLCQEVIARAKSLSTGFGTMTAPGLETVAFNASRNIEYICELTCIREDRSSFPAIVSATTLRDTQSAIIGYLLIGTYHTAHKQAEEVLHKAEALESAIFQQHNLSGVS